MNSLERVKSTLKGENTDRIPVIPEVVGVTARLKGKSIKDYVTSGEIIAECQLASQELFQYDAVMAFADLCVEAEAIGCDVVFPEDNYPYVKQPIMQSIDDLGKLSVPDPNKSSRMPEIIKAVKIMKKSCAGRVPVVAHALGPLTIASRIMDVEKMLYMIVDEPDNFKRLLSFTLEVVLAFIKMLLNAGADCIVMFNPSASQAMIPAKIFKEFELPNLKKIFHFIKKHDSEIMTWYSVAGPTHKIIKDMEHIPLDILTLDYLVPLDVAFGLSSTLCFNGNIKSLSFVNEGPDDIFAQSTELLKASLERGNFILGSGCEIPLNANLDNIKSLVSASEEMSRNFKLYGKTGKTKKLITFSPHQKKIYVDGGINLIEAAGIADIIIPRLCNKSGVCGSCLVQIENDSSKEYSKEEEIFLTREQKDKKYRLACQVNVSSDMEIYIPQESRIGNRFAVYQKSSSHNIIEGLAEKYVLNPSIRSIKVPLERKTESYVSDIEIIQNAVGKEAEFYPEEIRKMPEMVRNNNDNDRELFCILDCKKNRVLNLSFSQEIYGVAVDIGTTTIAIYIHNLETGKTVASGSTLNPQSIHGDNIMTRAELYIRRETDRIKLQSKITEGINNLILEITHNKGIDYNYIYKVVIVGNSVMHHMFLGLELKYLVRSPFSPVISAPYLFSNRDKVPSQKLAINENALILCPPLLNGLIGSDVTVGILASGLCQSRQPVLYVDLGTNGEIILGNKEKILATSVAAGPAFENCYLTSGRTAGSGVIYEVDIDEDFNVHYKTFENSKPSGLCGSAVVDTISSFLRLNIIDRKGHFIENSHCDSLRDGKYVLVPKQDTAFFQPLVIAAREIEEIQKAKGGIMAGITILMREYGITPEELDKIILTGTFGTNINIDNAINIGLIPRISKDKVEFAPNSAGVGAQWCLLFENVVEEIDGFVGEIKHINVANDNDFNNIFIDSMLFETAQNKL